MEGTISAPPEDTVSGMSSYYPSGELYNCVMFTAPVDLLYFQFENQLKSTLEFHFRRTGSSVQLSNALKITLSSYLQSCHGGHRISVMAIQIKKLLVLFDLNPNKTKYMLENQSGLSTYPF